MGYFPGDDIDVPTPEEIRRNRDLDRMAANGAPQNDPIDGPQYWIARCCGMPVPAGTMAGCVCPRCGQTKR